MTETFLDADADRLREECGVFGIFGHRSTASVFTLNAGSASSATPFRGAR